MEINTQVNNKKVFARIGWAMLVSMIVTNIVQAIFINVVAIAGHMIEIEAWVQFLSIGVGYYLVGFPVFYLMTKSLEDGKKKESRTLGLGKIIAAFCMCYCMVYLLNLATTLLMALVASLKGSEVINPLVNLIDGGTWIWALIFAGIASPIIEELMFRGIMLNKLRVYGDKVAIVTSALLFGLFHANFSQFFYATALGLVFAYVTLKTGKIKYAIILHIMVNILGSVIGPVIVGDGTNMVAVGLFGICLLAIVIAGLVLLIINRKKVNFTEGDVKLEKGTAFKAIWINGGMILYSLLCLASMVYILLL